MKIEYRFANEASSAISEFFAIAFPDQEHPETIKYSVFGQQACDAFVDSILCFAELPSGDEVCFELQAIQGCCLRRFDEPISPANVEIVCATLRREDGARLVWDGANARWKRDVLNPDDGDAER